MANEISVGISGSLSNTKLTESFNYGTLKFDQTTVGSHGPTVIVPSSGEIEFNKGDIGTLGWMFIRNLDTTNYIEWGPKSLGSMVGVGRIEPGECVALRLKPGVVIRWQANTAPVKIKVLLLED